MNISDMTQFQPTSFTTRAGKCVETKPHFATFNNKHNASKCKVFIVLYHRRFKLNDPSGLGVGDLHRQSGVNYDYIKSRVSKWAEWGYLKRNTSSNGPGRPLYIYSLADRGRHFIEDIVPPEWLRQYIAEIRTFKSTVPN